MVRLTDIAVRNLKAGETRREVPDRQQRGLYVIVQPTGRRGFAVRYRINGRTRKLTLQSGLSLAAARKAAANALYEVSQGKDPATAKQREREEERAAAADTLEAIAAEFFHREGAKIRKADQWQRTLQRLVFPTIGRRPIGDIRRKDVIRLLDSIEDNNGPAQADITLAIMRRVMNWHTVRDESFRSPIVKGMARHHASEHTRSRVLNDDELRALWKATESEGQFGAFTKFLVLTAARRNEAAHMRWSEIVGTDWTLPAARNKTKVDVTRPLSTAALTVLSKLPRIAGSEYVFNYDGRRLGGKGGYR
jgi:integrase